MDYTATIETPAGRVTAASDGHSLIGLWFSQQKYFASTLGAHQERGDLPIFEQTRGWLADYFAGLEPDPRRLALAPRGSAFRQAVWQILLEIPYRRVTTYGAIARRLGAARGGSMSAQAVGGAVGHNPVSIIIPCHRVVSPGGALTGYAGGLALKAQLLALEKADLAAPLEWVRAGEGGQLRLPL